MAKSKILLYFLSFYIIHLCFFLVVKKSFALSKEIKNIDKAETFQKSREDLPSFEGRVGKWNVFSIVNDGKKICYIVSYPMNSETNHNDDRKPYIMVTLFGKNKKEVSIYAGYKYRGNSNISVSVDEFQFRFIAETEYIAYFDQYAQDMKFIDKMLKNFRIVVFSESSFGTYAVDTYSLEGFRKAYEKMHILCNNI